jgi:hypothetical protein
MEQSRADQSRQSRPARITAATLILLALFLIPAPLLPPHRLAEAVQSTLGVQWKAAYLVATIGLQIAIYGALGLLAAFAVARAETIHRRLLHVVLLPAVTVAAAILIRSLVLGFVPIWINAVVPILACVAGTWFGLSLRSKRPWVAVVLLVLMAGGTLWTLLGPSSEELTRHTERQLKHLVAAGPQLPLGEEKIMAALRAAFAQDPGGTGDVDPVRQNRAAILALGLAVGDPRLARFVGLDPQSARTAFERLGSMTMRGREDWPRHFCLSAALAVLEHPLVSDAGGLMKEQMDALSRGSGFSFGDLAADRAGVRFAEAATHSEEAARTVRARIANGAIVDDIFPPVADLPENLTVEQFRLTYEGVGSPKYRQAVRDLEARLDRCALLSPVVPE